MCERLIMRRLYCTSNNNGKVKVISAYWFYERKICLWRTHTQIELQAQKFVLLLFWHEFPFWLCSIGSFRLFHPFFSHSPIRLTKNQPLKFIIDTFFGKFNVIGFATPPFNGSPSLYSGIHNVHTDIYIVNTVCSSGMNKFPLNSNFNISTMDE